MTRSLITVDLFMYKDMDATMDDLNMLIHPMNSRIDVIKS